MKLKEFSMENKQQELKSMMNHMKKLTKVTHFLNEDRTYRLCSLMKWAQQFNNMDRHVGDDEINGYRVSTVWVGLNHNYYDNGDPILFETMIFDKEKNDIYCERYYTWDEAAAGHKHAIEWVKNGCKDND